MGNNNVATLECDTALKRNDLSNSEEIYRNFLKKKKHFKAIFANVSPTHLCKIKAHFPKAIK